ncbi:MAG: holin [Sarcina sp.]
MKKYSFDWSRLKNYGLWVSIAALIPMIAQAFGAKIIPAEYQNIVNSILGICVAAGILNNPTTDNKGYLDDK